MESEDSNTETVSNPKLFAMDGETATLTQGTTLIKVIPASGDAAGSTVEIPQNLSITVKPEIVGESRVKIELTLANDAPGESSGDDVVTNEESLTSIVQINAGDVADGEIITTPFGTATLVAIAPVTPEQSAPMIAKTPLDTNPSAAVVAAAESTHVLSALSIIIDFPPNNFPESEASLNANSAEAAIAGVNDSIGPVNPKIIPILIACPSENALLVKHDTNMNIAVINFFIFPSNY